MQAVTPSSTDVSVNILVLDSTTFLPYESLTSATSGLALWWRKGAAGAKTALSVTDHTNLTDAHSDGKIKHIDDGLYRVDLVDAAIPTAEHEVTTFGGTATGYVILGGALVGKPVEVVSGSLVAASVTGNVGGNVTGSVGSVATGGITAGSIAADAIGASELAADAVAEIQSGLATAAGVWAYASRTLTSGTAAIISAVTGDRLTAYVGAYTSITLTGLTDFTGYKRIYFTVKANIREDADSDSILQVRKSNPADAANDGLLYVSGAAGTKANGSITVNSTTSITIIVLNAATALWESGQFSYDVWYIGSDDQPRPASEGGSFDIVDAVSRAAS